LVTKETGIRGGFPEKISAALKEGIIPLVIKRQENKKSYSMDEIRTAMEEILGN
ncbi:MAG TPA: precorrin-6X reductase, partial [Clostridiales bacterium]|nr:precorrin-6X reductase [Clostridiales bacterium]